jgi:arylsulfatase A-like enzyme
MLYADSTIIETDPDQRQLTRRYTERAVAFIEENRSRPFFLYVAHTMPHTPLGVSDRFAGKTRRGIYGDVVAELDWSVGEILKTIKRTEIEEQTFVLFTSDNGPWLIFGDHGGSAGPLRGGKKQLFEGGVRVPCIARWRGAIPAGEVCRDIAAIQDLFPTIVNWAGGALRNRRIDGCDIRPLLTGRNVEPPPRETFYYYWHRELHAVRWRQWKLQLPHVDRQAPDPDRIGTGGKRGAVVSVKRPLALYDLENDIGETTDVAARHPAVMKRLSQIVEQARTDLGDTLTGRSGPLVLPPGGIR